MKNPEQKKRATRLLHAGRSPEAFGGAVNPPIKRASTILAKTADGLYNTPKSLYGRMGTEVHDALIAGLKELEAADFVHLAPNGLGACSLAMASFVQSGDHFLLTDSAYGPTRRFATRYLKKMGVDVTIFDPRINAADFKALIRDNTRAVFFEAPGSLTFEVHKMRDLLPVCKEHSVTSIIDNTWGCGIVFQPLEFGFDVCVQALTKYVIGHSDGFGGAVMCRDEKLNRSINEAATDWGLSMSPDDAYLAQRGLRTIKHRVEAQGQSGLKIAEWLEQQPQVKQVLHPALPTHPDHEEYKAAFSGPSGLFSFLLHIEDKESIERFFAGIELFGFGFSWGGFESLMIPCNPQLLRTESPQWKSKGYGTLIRLQIGLEDSDDLIADLKAALDRL